MLFKKIHNDKRGAGAHISLQLGQTINPFAKTKAMRYNSAHGLAFNRIRRRNSKLSSRN